MLGHSVRGLRGIAGAMLVAAALVACTPPTPDRGVDRTPTPTGEPSPDASQTPSPPTAVVSVASVDVDGLGVTVAGFVSEVEETGGLCRFVLTAAISGTQVERETEGLGNRGTTSCGTATIPTAELSKDSWSVVLNYSSGDVEVISNPLEVIVP